MDAKGPQSLSEIMSQLFAARGWGRRESRLRLEEAWRDAIGLAAEKDTRVGSLRRGVLEIIVRNAVLLQELASFRKKELLDSLKHNLGVKQISDLRFRLGQF